MDLIPLYDPISFDALIERWKDKSIDGERLDQQMIFQIGMNGQIKMYASFNHKFENGKKINLCERIPSGFTTGELYKENGERVDYLFSLRSVESFEQDNFKEQIDISQNMPERIHALEAEKIDLQKRIFELEAENTKLQAIIDEEQDTKKGITPKSYRKFIALLLAGKMKVTEINRNTTGKLENLKTAQELIGLPKKLNEMLTKFDDETMRKILCELIEREHFPAKPDFRKRCQGG